MITVWRAVKALGRSEGLQGLDKKRPCLDGVPGRAWGGVGVGGVTCGAG